MQMLSLYSTVIRKQVETKQQQKQKSNKSQGSLYYKQIKNYIQIHFFL